MSSHDHHNPVARSSSSFYAMELLQPMRPRDPNTFIDCVWNIPSYVVDLTASMFGTGNDEALRLKQASLILWELLEHFDVVNDFLFLSRVISLTSASDLETSNRQIGMISIAYVACLYLISLIAYASRKWILYHRIDEQNQKIFLPIVVFKYIREFGTTSPETIHMFQRVSWTYQVITRIFEDIPRLFISTLFLIYFGKSIYTYFVICYSIALTTLTSILMGLSYPFFGTLSAMFSPRPPVGLPGLYEAAPLTRHFLVFLSANFGLWALASAACLPYVSFALAKVLCCVLLVNLTLTAASFTGWLFSKTPQDDGFQRLPLVPMI